MCWNVASSPRSVASGPCRSIRSITETMLDEAREECNRLELQRWRLKEQNRLSEGTALKRDGEAWSLVERTWVTT